MLFSLFSNRMLQSVSFGAEVIGFVYGDGPVGV